MKRRGIHRTVMKVTKKKTVHASRSKGTGRKKIPPTPADKKAKAEDEAIIPPQPKTKGLENPRNQHEYDGDRDVEGGEEVDLSEYMPKTKGLKNPRNINEYYRNLYRKVKGMD